MKKYPIVEPIAVMVLGLVIFIASFSIETIVRSIAIGADFMPKLIGVIFMILGAALLPESIKAQKAAAAAVPEKKDTAKLSKKEFAIKYMHYIVWVWTLLYTLSMRSLGFLFSSIFYLFGAMYLLTIREEKRNWLLISILSIVLPLFIYILFRKQFYLMLPIGICRYIPINILR